MFKILYYHTNNLLSLHSVARMTRMNGYAAKNVVIHGEERPLLATNVRVCNSCDKVSDFALRNYRTAELELLRCVTRWGHRVDTISQVSYKSG